MTGALARVVDVRPDERRLVTLAFATLFAVIAGHTVLETARDALFLELLPASRLTFVYLLLAVLGLAVPWYSTRFVRRFGRRDAVVFTVMTAAFGTTWLHFQPVTPVMVYVIYGWSGLLATVMMVQFWMLVAQLFTVAQGKRLFPVIAAGGVLGAVVGGAVAAGSLRLWRDEGGVLGATTADPSGAGGLLLVAAALFVSAAVVLTAIGLDDRAGKVRSVSADRTPALLRSLSLLRQEPYVGRIAIMVALSTAALLATDYLFKLTAKTWIPAAELGSFFAQYYAVMNGAALLMQLFVAMRLVQRLGVVAALAILPLCLLGGGAGVLVLGGGLLAVLLTKGADGALRHSLHRVSSELLYLPLSSEIRDRSKSLVDSVVVRGAQALTAALILGLAAAELESVRLLAGLVAVLAAGWALSAVALRRRYLDLFRRKLGKGSLGPDIRFDDLDVSSVESVMDALSSPDEVRVVAAMDLLAEGRRTRLIPALILYHESEQVLVRALEVVPQRERADWQRHAERLLSHPSEQVRVAAVRALGRAEQLEPLETIEAEASPAVRAHAAFFLAHADTSSAPEAHPAMAELMRCIPRERVDSVRAPSLPPPGREEESHELRLSLLDALREDGDERWVSVLLHLADSTDGHVIERAALAIARVNDPRFVPLLIGRLARRQGRAALRSALVELGEPALDALRQALNNPATPSRVHLHIPRAMAQFGTRRAAEMLTAQLSDQSDGAVRYKILRGLGHLATRHGIAVDRPPVETAIAGNLREYLRLLSLEAPLRRRGSDELSRSARLSGRLLVGLLEDKREQALQRAFRLLQLIHPNEDVRGIYLALKSAEPRRRASALEFLDALARTLQERCRELFHLVADDLEPEDRLARAASHLKELPASVDDALLSLLEDEDTSLAGLAAYHVRALGESALCAELDTLRDHRPSLGMFGELRPALAACDEDCTDERTS